MNGELERLLNEGVRAARTAGDLLRQRPESVRHKGAIDLVTEVDLASERCIRECLAPLGIPVQGEEAGGVDEGTRWVVDPVDGTTNFVHGYPFYCVSIALVEGDTPVVGVIFDPVRDHVYAAATGRGTFRNEERLAVAGARTLDEALCVTGFPYDRRERAPVYLAFVERAIRQTQGLRRSGSAAMDLATVAAGQVDFFWEFGLKAWDTAAGQILVTEAGGVVTQLDGLRHVPGAPHVLATNPYLHEAVVALFAGLEAPGTPANP